MSRRRVESHHTTVTDASDSERPRPAVPISAKKQPQHVSKLRSARDSPKSRTSLSSEGSDDSWVALTEGRRVQSKAALSPKNKKSSIFSGGSVDSRSERRSHSASSAASSKSSSSSTPERSRRSNRAAPPRRQTGPQRSSPARSSRSADSRASTGSVSTATPPVPRPLVGGQDKRIRRHDTYSSSQAQGNPSKQQQARKDVPSVRADSAAQAHSESMNASCTGGIKQALRSIVGTKPPPPPRMPVMSSRTTASSFSHDNGLVLHAGAAKAVSKPSRASSVSSYSSDGESCSCSDSQCSVRFPSRSRANRRSSWSSSSASSSGWSSSSPPPNRGPRRQLLSGRSPWVSTDSGTSFSNSKGHRRFSEVMRSDDEDEFDDSVSRPGAARKPAQRPWYRGGNSSASMSGTQTTSSQSFPTSVNRQQHVPGNAARMNRLALIAQSLDRAGHGSSALGMAHPNLYQHGYLNNGTHPYTGATVPMQPAAMYADSQWAYPPQQQIAWPMPTAAGAVNVPPMQFSAMPTTPVQSFAVPSQPPIPHSQPTPRVQQPIASQPQPGMGGWPKSASAARAAERRSMSPSRLRRLPPVSAPAGQPSAPGKAVISHLEGELRYLRGIVRSLTRSKAAAHKERWVETLPDSVASAIGNPKALPPSLKKKRKTGGKKARGRAVSRPVATPRVGLEAVPAQTPRSLSAAPTLRAHPGLLAHVAGGAPSSYRALKDMVHQRAGAPAFNESLPASPLNWQPVAAAAPSPPRPTAMLSMEANIARSMDAQAAQQKPASYLPLGSFTEHMRPPLVPVTAVIAPLPRHSQSVLAPTMVSSPLRPPADAVARPPSTTSSLGIRSSSAGLAAVSVNPGIRSTSSWSSDKNPGSVVDEGSRASLKPGTMRASTASDSDDDPWEDVQAPEADAYSVKKPQSSVTSLPAQAAASAAMITA